MQSEIAKDVTKVFSSNVLTLVGVKHAYSTQIANASLGWLEIQLNNISKFAGAKDKMGEEQITELANIIYTEYYYFNVREILYFFYCLKSGQFGKFYGAIDPMVITSALIEFTKIRSININRINIEILKNEELAKELDRENKKDEYISKAEWDEIKWLWEL